MAAIRGYIAANLERWRGNISTRPSYLETKAAPGPTEQAA